MKKIIIGVLLSFVSLFALDTNLLQMAKINYDKNSTGFIRHLKLYQYPAWVSQITLSSGKKLLFSSPKSMFELYFRPGKWYDLNIRKESDFKQLLVTDFKTMKPIEAKGAFFVYGSNIISPSGDDLVPFSSYSDAKVFMVKNNGKRILSFDRINMALINLLNGSI